MRIYSLIMAISITCGGGGKAEDASAGTDGESSGDPSGGTSGAEASTPTTGEDPPGTGTEEDPDLTTGPATSQGSTTGDPGMSTGEEDVTGGEEATADTGGGSTGESTGESTGGGAPGNASVDDSCAPDDGAALELRVGLDEASCGAPWSGDQLSLLVYQGAPLTPGVYPLDGGFGASVFDAGDGLVFGTVGSLTIESWSDEEVVGSYEVTLEDRSMHSGSFVGPHCLTMPMCG
jgi:hypothetical protein